MKLLLGVILLAFLNTGCGGLKHTKAIASTAPAVQEKHLSAVRELKNNLSEVAPYEVNGQQSYKIIARVSRAEVADFATNINGNLLQIGTLETTRIDNIYAPLSEGAKPDSNSQERSENLLNVPVFLIQDDSSSNQVALAVTQGDFDAKLRKTADAVNVKYNHVAACAQLVINDLPEESGNFQGMYAHILDGKVFECHDLGDCTTSSILIGDTTLIHRNFDELLTLYPKSKCNGNELRYTSQVKVFNESHVSHYWVNPSKSFGAQMDKLSFEPAPNGN